MTLYQQLAEKLSKTQTQTLERLLLAPKDQYRTRFEQLRAQPIPSTATTLEEALNRVEELRAIGIGRVNLDDVAENRLAPILGLSIWAGTLERYSRNRRLATLLVLFQHLERDAVDDALTVFDQLMQKIGLGAHHAKHVLHDAEFGIPEFGNSGRVLACFTQGCAVNSKDEP